MTLTIKFAVGIVLVLIIATLPDATTFPQEVTVPGPSTVEAEEGCNCPPTGVKVCGSDNKVHESACTARCKGVKDCLLTGGWAVGSTCLCSFLGIDEFRNLFSK